MYDPLSGKPSYEAARYAAAAEASDGGGGYGGKVKQFSTDFEHSGASKERSLVETSCLLKVS